MRLLRKQVSLDHVDTAIEVMKEAARRIKDFPQHFARYQQEMKELWERAHGKTKMSGQKPSENG